MELRCRVFRAGEAGELEEAINRFLAEELPPLGPVQLEEITQSESAGGTTIVVWYSLVSTEAEAADDGEDDEVDYDEPDEVDGRELA